MSESMSFDEYCLAHEIAEEEAPTAFAAYLHELGGWDGPMVQVDPAAPSAGNWACGKCDGMDVPRHHRTCAKASSP